MHDIHNKVIYFKLLMLRRPSVTVYKRFQLLGFFLRGNDTQFRTRSIFYWVIIMMFL